MYRLSTIVFLLLGVPAFAFTNAELCALSLADSKFKTSEPTNGLVVLRSYIFKDAQTGKKRPPNPQEEQELKRLFNADKIISYDRGAPPVQFGSYPDKVLLAFDKNGDLHSYYAGGREVFPHIRGGENIIDNKWTEYVLATHFRGDIMPLSRQATDLLEHYQAYNPYKTELQTLSTRLNAYVTSGQIEMSASDKWAVVAVLRHFLNAVKVAFPTGAFVKHVGEWETGDRQQTIVVPKATADELAQKFISELQSAKATLGTRPQFNDKSLINLLEKERYSAVNLVIALLLHPEEIMAQQKINIAKTRDGLPLEIRIDFDCRGVVNSTLRWGYDVSAEYEQVATQAMQKYLMEASPELRCLGGGADVAILTDGSVKVIEWNFGNGSDFMDPTKEMIPGTIFVSKASGHPTELMQRLNDVSPPEDRPLTKAAITRLLPKQSALLNSTKPIAAVLHQLNHSIDDLKLCDAYSYLRDRMIAAWLKNPQPTTARLMLTHLRWLNQQQKPRITDPDVLAGMDLTLKYAETFVAEKLNSRPISQPLAIPN